MPAPSSRSFQQEAVCGSSVVPNILFVHAEEVSDVQPGHCACSCDPCAAQLSLYPALLLSVRE